MLTRRTFIFFSWQASLLVLLTLVTISQTFESCQDDEVSVQLVNGSSERNGRVELCWNNQWKAVCDSGWDQAEARTVCTELGYLNSNRRAIAVSSSHFGDTHEIHQLSQWNCGLSDMILAYCSKSTTHQPCSPSETAGVYCQGEDDCHDGELRLMNGSSPSRYEGRVEICFIGVWETICSNGWDSREATVVCRQLGTLVQSLGIAVLLSDSYGKGEGPILQDRIFCGLNDTRLADCIRYDPMPGMVHDGCTHRQDAGVICRGGSNCRDWEIRLVGTQSQNQGMIEICFGGVWGTVCGDQWDDRDSRVACQQLGYIHGYATTYTENSRETQNIQHLGEVYCTGQEPRLMDCSHEDIGVYTCSLISNEKAAVVCSVAYSATIITSTQAISTTYSFPVVFPTVHSTAISAQASSTFAANNIIMLEHTNTINISSTVETLTVSKVIVSIASSTSFLPPMQRKANILASVLSILSLCVIVLILVALFIGIKKKHSNNKNRQNREVPLAEGGDNESHTDQHNFTENIHKEIFTNNCCCDNPEVKFVNPAEVSPQHLKNEKSFLSIKNKILNFCEEIPISQQQLVNNTTTIGVEECKDVLEIDVVDVHIIEESNPSELYSQLCPTYATLEPCISVVPNREDVMKNTDHYQRLHYR